MFEKKKEINNRTKRNKEKVKCLYKKDRFIKNSKRKETVKRKEKRRILMKREKSA